MAEVCKWYAALITKLKNKTEQHTVQQYKQLDKVSDGLLKIQGGARECARERHMEPEMNEVVPGPWRWKTN